MLVAKFEYAKLTLYYKKNPWPKKNWKNQSEILRKLNEKISKNLSQVEPEKEKISSLCKIK